MQKITVIFARLFHFLASCRNIFWILLDFGLMVTNTWAQSPLFCPLLGYITSGVNQFAEDSRSLCAIPWEHRPPGGTGCRQEGRGYRNRVLSAVFLQSSCRCAKNCATKDVSEPCPHISTRRALRAKPLGERQHAGEALQRCIRNAKCGTQRQVMPHSLVESLECSDLGLLQKNLHVALDIQ